MKLAPTIFPALAACALIGLIACSDDESSSGASACDQAAQIAKDCSSSQSTDSGTSSVSFNFDAAKCKESDQGKKSAQCIVDNKSKCDCMLKCSLNGTCS